jgi:pleiotropic regulator 1
VEEYKPSVAVVKRLASRWPKPKWHAPWKTYRVISGHLGWVSSIAFDPGNEWFATGSADRTIKIWDTASGQLKLTLTGHTEQVMGLGVSDKYTYMFSCGLDKKVMCWDLETNKVRSCISLHALIFCTSLRTALLWLPTLPSLTGTDWLVTSLASHGLVCDGAHFGV